MKKAVIIGINYLTVPDSRLSGCINDALNIKNYLITIEGFEESNIQLLTDETLVKPTKSETLKAMDWLVKDAKAGDSLWFSQSSHGSQQRDTNGDETDRLDETLVPLDYKTAGMITDDEVRRRLVDTLPAGVKLTAVLDLCHSATGMDLLWKFEDKSRYIKSGKPTVYNSSEWLTATTVSKTGRYAESKADVVCISGCRDNSYSADAFEEGRAQGALTYGLLKSLNNLRKAGKTTVSLQRLLKDISCLLLIKKYEQKPQLSTGRKTALEAPFKI